MQEEKPLFGLNVNVPEFTGFPFPFKINSWLPVKMKLPDAEKFIPFMVSVFIEKALEKYNFSVTIFIKK